MPEGLAEKVLATKIKLTVKKQEKLKLKKAVIICKITCNYRK